MLFGTWDGVFTTVIVNIFGVIVLLRSGWLVAQAGIGFTFLIIIACGQSTLGRLSGRRQASQSAQWFCSLFFSRMQFSNFVFGFVKGKSSP